MAVPRPTVPFPPLKSAAPQHQTRAGVPPAIPQLPEPTGGEQYADLYQWAADHVATRVVWATPEWAEQVLDTLNLRNRKLKPANVTKVAEDITDGVWAFNGEAIIFDTAGVLLDGQHRLRGIVQAGVPVPVLAVFGVPKDVFDTLDQQKARSRVDVLTIPVDGRDPIKNPSYLAGALNWVHRWEMNRLDDINCVVPNADVLGLLDRYPGIQESLKAVQGRCTRGTHSAGLMAALHYIFGQSDDGLRDTFFAQLLDGTDVKPGSHVFLLNRWLRNKAGTKSSSHYVEMAAVIVKTWNRLKAGDVPGQAIGFRPDEKFPQIQ